MTRWRIFLHDEAPAIGCGWRIADIEIGRKWVRLATPAGRARLPLAAWAPIARAGQELKPRREDMTTMTKNDLCKLIAYLEGTDGRASAATKEKAIARLERACAANGINAKGLLDAADFDGAMAALPTGPIAAAAMDEPAIMAAPAPAPAKAKAPATPTKRGAAWAAREAAAARGELPEPPELNGDSNAPYRVWRDQITALAEAGDLNGLIDKPLKTYDSSWQAISRYRDLCVRALRARG